MRRLTLTEWASILSASLSVTWFAVHSAPAMWKFYMQMPGIAAGIFIVWALVHYTSRVADVRIVYALTVLINALVYAVLFEVFLRLRAAANSATRVSRTDSQRGSSDNSDRQSPL